MLRRFEPGEGSVYLVGYFPLTEADTEATGLAGHFFAFGPCRAPIPGWVFRDCDVPDLEYRYFASKLRDPNTYQLAVGDVYAAFHAFCCLSGRRGHGAPQPVEQMDWRSDWREQLLGNQPAQLLLSAREHLVLGAALSYVSANVDDVNNAYGEGEDVPLGQVMVQGNPYPRLTEAEVLTLKSRVEQA
jgi:hypothetical protein